jgi:hypothetical protein
MKNVVTIYRFNKDQTIFDIVPLKVKRDWMSSSREKFVYKCLPLNIANQYGWAVLSPVDFTVFWDSGTTPEDISIKIHQPGFDKKILSYFGEAVLTVHLDFMVKTPENYSIYVRGVPNREKPGVIPLDALVETDWLPFTFTYNFRLISPGTYHFKKGEPLFSFFPIERATVENFSLVEAFIEDDKDLYADLQEFNQHSKDRNFDDFYHRLYFKGKTPSKTVNIQNHTTKLAFNKICTRSDR